MICLAIKLVFYQGRGVKVIAFDSLSDREQLHWTANRRSGDPVDLGERDVGVDRLLCVAFVRSSKAGFSKLLKVEKQ